MNRYRTTPGLAPSKATGTTTCQKCLGKGHYSYECKSSLQSRPYVSRPSRSQQLRNPKLKPSLAETKLEDSDVTASGIESHSPEGGEGTAATAASLDRKDELHRDQDQPGSERRQSFSASSVDSVSTISTKSSISEQQSDHRNRRRSSHEQIVDSGRAKAAERARRSRKDRRSRSPERSRDISLPVDQESRVPSSVVGHEHDRRASRPYRQRSLSPYSRRLALTHAMNSRK